MSTTDHGPTIEPVTSQGWYELVVGGFAYYVWTNGAARERHYAATAEECKPWSELLDADSAAYDADMAARRAERGAP